jgi:hypothetical protein
VFLREEALVDETWDNVAFFDATSKAIFKIKKVPSIEVCGGRT